MRLDVLYNKSCQRMDEVPDGSIDMIFTDPPYGIAFMGKEWDKFNEIVNPQGAYEQKKGFKKLPRQSSAFIIEYFTPIWRECLRVLKPGAFAFVMCIPRQDCLARMVVSLEEAGFWVGFTPIFWAYASGFPKAANMGKKADKRFGVKSKVISKEKFDGTAATLKGKPSRKDWYDQGQGGQFTPVYERTIGTSEQGKQLQGSYGGFQPKPAVEVILVAMKPLSEKTYVDQALRNGKGVTWLDEGKIPYESDSDKESARFGTQMDIRNNNYKTPKGIYGKNVLSSPQGRFPANLLVSDDALNDGKITKSGKDAVRRQEGMFVEHHLGGVGNLQVYHPDSGSFSRYFSLDSWFEKRLRELPKSVQKTFPFLIVPKASKAEKNRGCEELYWEKDESSFGYHQIDKERWQWLGQEEERIYRETGKRISLRARGNIHPTVKPLKLPCYLITIGSRPGDVIVDPFMGSGTMPVGAKILGRHYIAFETEAENVKIAKARLSAIEPRLI